MLSLAAQTRLRLFAVQTFETGKTDGEEIYHTIGRERCRALSASSADARILALAADGAAACARSRDAAVPPLAAPARSDRAAMADPAGAGCGGGERGHRTR